MQYLTSLYAFLAPPPVGHTHFAGSSPVISAKNADVAKWLRHLIHTQTFVSALLTCARNPFSRPHTHDAYTIQRTESSSYLDFVGSNPTPATTYGRIERSSALNLDGKHLRRRSLPHRRLSGVTFCAPIAQSDRATAS